MAFVDHHLTSKVSYMPFVIIPTYLLDLTKIKNIDENSTKIQIYQIALKNPDFAHVLKLMHPNYQASNTSVKEIIYRYSFDHFLEIIIGSILNKRITGQYLKKVDLSPVLEMENDCLSLRPKGLNPSPRMKLLWIYLKFSNIELYGNSMGSIDPHLFFKKIAIFNKHINTNIYESDWMVLLLYLLSDVLTEENIFQNLKERKELSNILSDLPYRDKKNIYRSLLNYANSVDEEHIFFQELI